MFDRKKKKKKKMLKNSPRSEFDFSVRLALVSSVDLGFHFKFYLDKYLFIYLYLEYEP